MTKAFFSKVSGLNSMSVTNAVPLEIAVLSDAESSVAAEPEEGGGLTHAQGPHVAYEKFFF